MGIGKWFGIVVFIGALSTSAFGSIIAGDPAAEFSGTVQFIGGTEWQADVQYAVYAPGMYPGVHPDKATSYIYTYQIFNRTSSSVVLSSLSVGLDPLANAAHAASDSSYGAAGGQAPLISILPGTPATSAVWLMNVLPGQDSTVLLYSSPNNYTFSTASLVDHGQSDMQLLPSPIPEPMTMSLLALGGMAIIRRKR